MRRRIRLGHLHKLDIDKFMGAGKLHPRVWGSWLTSVRGQLFLKGRGGQKRFPKKVGKQMALRFSWRMSREIWGPCQEAMETNWKAWNSIQTQENTRASGQTVEQVTQKQCEVSIRGDNRNPTGVFLGILLCLTLLEQGVWARWLQRSVCWIKAGTSGFSVYNRMQGNSSEHEILQSVNPNLSI